MDFVRKVHKTLEVSERRTGSPRRRGDRRKTGTVSLKGTDTKVIHITSSSAVFVESSFDTEYFSLDFPHDM